MKKRLLTIISIILMTVLMLGSMGTSVFAIPNYDESIVETLHYDLKADAGSRSIVCFTKGAKTTSLELFDPASGEKLASSRAVASFKNNKYGTSTKITFKKKGRVYVRHKYINKDGQSCDTFRVIEIVDTPYTCPIKTLKLGKINMTKKLGHSQNLVGKAFKGKVIFKVKKGWKLIEICKYNGTTFETTGNSPKITTLKKGKTVTLKKGWNYRLRFKKGKKTASICYKAR